MLFKLLLLSVSIVAFQFFIWKTPIADYQIICIVVVAVGSHLEILIKENDKKC